MVRVGSTVGVAEVTVTAENEDGEASETPQADSEAVDGDAGEVAVGRGSFRVFRPED